jgi:hypothetical protein
MLSGLPSFSRMVIKALEIAGAGLTSALVAYLIGRFGATTPAPTAPPPPAIVQLAPADEEMMRSVRSDQAALLDQLRNDSQARKTPTVIVVPPAQADVPAANAAAKPTKNPPPVARKEPKPERTRAADAKPRAEPVVEQPLQIQPPVAAADAAPRNAGQPAVTPVPAPPAPAQSESKLASAFKWLLPARDRTPENVPPASVPRPPKPIGELLPSEM